MFANPSLEAAPLENRWEYMWGQKEQKLEGKLLLGSMGQKISKDPEMQSALAQFYEKGWRIVSV